MIRYDTKICDGDTTTNKNINKIIEPRWLSWFINFPANNNSCTFSHYHMDMDHFGQFPVILLCMAILNNQHPYF